jgi:uncharacterized protein YbjT (DUF2867 family)
MKEKIALLLGASGSVGFELLKTLLNHSAYQKVVVYVRRPFDHSKISSPTKLIQKIVPEMTPSALSKAVTETLAAFSTHNQEPEFMAFSALGVGAKTAELTIDQHREIDVYLNQAFAQALQHSSQVKYLALLSAIGANPKAKTTGSGAAGMARYARVKGEAEEAVKQHGPKIVSIFRPAMIRGSQHTPKFLDTAAPLLDRLIPQKYHSISTQQLALAMVAASLIHQESSEVYTYPEMLKLIHHR